MGNQTGKELNNEDSEKKKFATKQERIRLLEDIKSIKEKDIDDAMKQTQQRASDGGDAKGKRSIYKKSSAFVSSIPEPVRDNTSSVDPSNYDYPFENLVFEGGGSKGVSYVGVAKVLSNCGILKQIRRFSGTSVGSITATFLAIGMTAEECGRYVMVDMDDIVYDAPCGLLSFIPNLIMRYGWNPGNRFYNWTGEVLKENTGDADITFMDVYKMFGNELCIVLTNLNYMEEFYCHPKTTPDLPVRMAIRMSISMPGVFQAKSMDRCGRQIMCVDGGMLCNYPIHCYDGWWLSLKRGDSFLERLQPLDAIPYLLSKSERFGAHNDKTLGVKCYSEFETDMWRTILDAKIGHPQPEEYPDTHLSRKFMDAHEENQIYQEHENILNAVNAFLKALKEADIDGNENITQSELESIFQKELLSKEHADRLFGKGVTPEQVFKALDTNGDGKISCLELVLFIEQSGISIQQRFLRFQKTEVTGLRTFVETLYGALSQNLYRVFVEDKDINRTIGINTAYVDSKMFKLEDADKEFLIQRGEHATIEYLKSYAVKNNLLQRQELMTSESSK